MSDGPNIAEFRSMMTQVRQGETDRPDDFVFADPSQRKKKEKPRPKWNANNKYAATKVDDWMGAPGTKAKKGYKVKSVSTAPPPEDPVEDEAPACPSIATEASSSSRRWKPPQKTDAALPPWMSAAAPKPSPVKKWTPKKSTPPPPPVNRPSPAEEKANEEKEAVGEAPEEKVKQPEETAKEPEESIEEPVSQEEVGKSDKEVEVPAKEIEETAEVAAARTPETNEDSEVEVASDSEAYEVDSEEGDDESIEKEPEIAEAASDVDEEEEVETEVPMMKLQDFSLDEIAMGLSVSEGGSKEEWIDKLKESMAWAMKFRKADE